MNRTLRFILSLFSSSSLLFANFEDDDSHDFFNTPSIVNVMTGNLVLEATDLIVPGIEPLYLKRTYTSGQGKTKKGGWTFLQHGYIQVPLYDDPFIYATEPSGSRIKYKAQGREYCKKSVIRHYQPLINEDMLGLSNVSQVEISGRTNLKNNKLLHFETEKKILIKLGNGGERTYRSRNGKDYYLHEEIRPNGNKICYLWSKDSPVKIYSTNPAGNKTYAWIEFHYSDKEDSENFFVTTSDGKKREYRYEKKRYDKGGYFHTHKIKRYFLRKILENDKLLTKLDYTEEFKDLGPVLQAEDVLNTTFFEIDFYQHKNNLLPNGEQYFIHSRGDGRMARVKCLKQPFGPSGEMVPTRFYKYFPGENLTPEGFQKPGVTEVEDCNGALTAYHFSEKLRMQQIETYQKKDGRKFLICKQKLLWGKDNREGDLLAQALLDDSDSTLSLRTFSYDPKGNILQERLWGNLSGQAIGKFQESTFSSPGSECYEKTFTYSSDNLLLSQREQNGLTIQYAYLPKTDLLLAKYTCNKDKIYSRQFFEYDEDHILIKEITDNGTSLDKNDLSCVTQRLTKIFAPKKHQPALGFPETIAEYFWNPLTGQDELLLKTKLDYSPSCQILRKDLYEADDKLSFSFYFEYDKDGNLVKETNELGEASYYQYDAKGQRIYEKKAGASTYTISTYDPAGRLTRSDLHDAERNVFSTHYHYDTLGNLLQTILPNGNTLQCIYDPLGRKIQEKHTSFHDGNSSLIAFTYDASGNIAQVTNALGETTSFQYNFYKKPTEIRKPDGSTISHIYNLDGTLQKTILEDNSYLLYTYDFLGRMLTKEIYSSQGSLLAREEWQYNAFHLVSHKDPKELITFFTYDAAGRKIAETQEERRIHFTYDSLGRVRSSNTDTSSLITLYDIAGRVIEERHEDLHGTIFSKTQYRYDNAGNRIELLKATPDGEAIEYYFYDSLNRLIKTIDPLGNTTLIAYKGFPTQEKIILDPLGNETIETYDNWGRLIKTEQKHPLEPPFSRTEYKYDQLGRKVCEINSVYIGTTLHSTQETSWEYDSSGKISKQIEGNGKKVTQFTYDAKGRLNTLIKPDRTSIHYLYDGLDRLLELRSSDIHYQFTYEDGGKIIRVKDLVSNQTFEKNFNNFGQLLSENLNGISIIYSYDGQGRLNQLSLPDHSFIDYLYEAGHLSKVQRRDSQGQIIYGHRYSDYKLSTTPLTEELIGGLGVLERKIDRLGRVYQVKTTFFEQAIQAFDAKHNPLQVSNSLFGETRYAYDALEQLTEEANSLYLYDSLGNRLKKNFDSYEVDNLNELLNSGNDSYSYDLNGNLIQKDSVEYQYDSLNRLLSVNAENSSVRFTYDPWNRRISKSCYTFEDGSWIKTSELFYIYQEDIEIGALDAEKNIIELRVLGNGLSADIGAAIAIELAGKVYAPIHDLFGNIAVLISLDTRQIAEAYQYSAFGEIMIYDHNHKVQLASLIDNPWRFSSKRSDDETGLVFFGGRYYEPTTGRWISPDPLNFLDGPNLYAFVHNNPLTQLDPTGFSALGFDFRFELQGPQGSRIFSCPLSMVTTQPLGYISRTVGSALEFIGTHFLPDIPVVKDSIEVLGQIFSLNLSFEPTPKQELKFLKTQGLSLANRKIIYANGFLNMTKEDCQESAMALSRECGAPVDPFYTPSRGFMCDLIDAILLFFEINTPNSQIFETKLLNYLQNTGDNVPVMLIVHSRAAMYAYQALRNLDKRYKDRLHVIGVGPAKIIPEEMAYYVRNYISKSDPIPYIGDPIGTLKAHLFKQGNVTFLGPNGRIFDHLFTSPTYLNRLDVEIHNFLTK